MTPSLSYHHHGHHQLLQDQEGNNEATAAAVAAAAAAAAAGAAVGTDAAGTFDNDGAKKAEKSDMRKKLKPCKPGGGRGWRGTTSARETFFEGLSPSRPAWSSRLPRGLPRSFPERRLPLALVMVLIVSAPAPMEETRAEKVSGEAPTEALA